MTHRLSDTPQETWGNTILFRLATELGYTPDWIEPSVSAEAVITANPDQILERALEVIWMYQELTY